MAAWKRGPMLAVASATLETVAKYGGRKGWSTESRWVCKLACGHVVKRYGPGDMRQPTKARCEVCGTGEP